VFNPFRAAWVFDHNKFVYVALLIIGWIDPLFLMTLALALLKRHQRLIAMLRITLLLMIPFCRVVLDWRRDTKSVVASRFNLETYSWAGR
jgi:hypothetical protein